MVSSSHKHATIEPSLILTCAGISDSHNDYGSSSKHDAAGIVPGHNVTEASHAHGGSAGQPGETKFDSHNFKENDGFHDTHRENPNPQNGNMFKFKDHKEDSAREGKHVQVHSSKPDGERVDGNGHFFQESHDGVDVKEINGATDTVYKNTSGAEFRGMFQKHHTGPDNTDAHDSKVSHSGALDSQHQKEEHTDPKLHTVHETTSGKGSWSFNMVGNNALGDLAQESKNWPKPGEMSQTGKPGWGKNLPKNAGEMDEVSKVDLGNTHPKRSDDELLIEKLKKPKYEAQDAVLPVSLELKNARPEIHAQSPPDEKLVEKRESGPKGSDAAYEMAKHAEVDLKGDMYSHTAPDDMLTGLHDAVVYPSSSPGKPRQNLSPAEMAKMAADASSTEPSDRMSKRSVDEMLVHKHKSSPEHTPSEKGIVRLEHNGDAIVSTNSQLLGEGKLCRYKGSDRYYACLSSEWNSDKIVGARPQLEKPEDEAALRVALGADTGDGIVVHIQARDSSQANGDPAENVLSLPSSPYIVGHAGANAVQNEQTFPANPLHTNAVAYAQADTYGQAVARSSSYQPNHALADKMSEAVALNTPHKFHEAAGLRHPYGTNDASPHHASVALIPSNKQDGWISVPPTALHKFMHKSGNDSGHNSGKMTKIEICSVVVMSLSLFGCLLFLAWIIPRKINARRSRKRAVAADSAQTDIELAEFNAELDHEIVVAAAQHGPNK